MARVIFSYRTTVVFHDGFEIAFNTGEGVFCENIIRDGHIWVSDDDGSLDLYSLASIKHIRFQACHREQE